MTLNDEQRYSPQRLKFRTENTKNCSDPFTFAQQRKGKKFNTFQTLIDAKDGKLPSLLIEVESAAISQLYHYQIPQ